MEAMLTTADPLPNVRKIAFLRANGIGDFIFALPALEALRAAYPAAEIVLLGKSWHEQFLAGRPGPVARVVAVPPCRGVGEGEDFADDPAALDRFFAAMAGERFDLALQCHGGGGYSNPFLRRLGARLTAGLKAPEAAPLDRWVPYVYFQSEILRYLEVAALVGAPPTALEPRLAVTDADRREACRVVPEDDRPLVALHPGASDPRRWWPAARFAVAGDALAAAGARVVVIGADATERELVAAVAGGMRAGAQNLWGALSLGGLAGLLARCRVVVSNDSGPLHLAAAVGTATVGIYWGFNLVTAGPLTRARRRPVVSWRQTCPVCGHLYNPTIPSCAHRESLVADAPASEVIVAALDLLATG